jgi:DNA-binding response OmpR family regulator
MENIKELPKIFVAEDDPVFLRLLSATLAKWGYKVAAFREGEEAWQALQAAEPPVLAILDWMMPGMDGLEICQKIRAHSRTESAYVILLTARDNREDLIQGLQAGADDYIAKPFDNRALQARLGVGLRVLRLQKALAFRVEELEKALARVKQLQGLLPICSYCKKIRNDQNYWQQVEGYLSEHSEAQFSHGICPDCYEKIVKPELAQAWSQKGNTP